MTVPSLSGWNCTLPIKSATGAIEIKPAVETSPWLVREANGDLTMFGPSTGEHTPNSANPRTELVRASGWLAGTSGPHTLSVSCTITNVPANGQRVIFGQIHGQNASSSVPFVMLNYAAGKIYVTIKQLPIRGSAGNPVDYPLLDAVTLPATIGYTISDLGDGTLRIRADCNGVANVVQRVPSAFLGTDVRFQCGSYEQATSPLPLPDGAKITFHSIDVLAAAPDPAPTPTPVPVPIPVPAPVPTPAPAGDNAKKIKKLLDKIAKLNSEIADRQSDIADYQAQIKKLGG